MAANARLDWEQSFALVKTLIFFAIVPGTLGGYLPYRWQGSPRIPPFSEFTANEWAGAALVLLGLVGLLWCGWEFATRGRGTPAAFDAPIALVVRGPYQWVRNPMYVSVATAVAGQALFFRSIFVLQYLTVGWVMFHLFVLLYEEPTLRRLFGDSYADYCKRVPRWIPRPRRRTL